MIGFLDVPSGRMGNVLIQYMFMRQLAEKIGIDYFHVKLPYDQYFEGLGRRNISLGLLLSKKWQINLKYIENIGVDAFIEEAVNKNREGYAIVLEPPLLGHLFEFQEDNPARFLRIKEKYALKICNTDNKIMVGLHFRGTDFKAWNSVASLSAEYYLDAIELLMKELSEDPRGVCWKLFTDDNDFPAYCATVKYLQEKGADLVRGDAERSMIDDFYQLSQCDYIVSSPSTYAIVAAIMGKENKKVIQNKQWVEYCVQKGEVFWRKMKENEIPWYQVVEFL